MNARVAAEVFAPGEYLKDELEARGWSQIELAEVLGRPPRLISEITSGKRAITPETAKGFAAAFGTSAQLWMNLETAYQLSKAKIEESEVSRRAALYGNYPVKEMIRRGWVMASTSVEVLEQRFAEFFAAPSLHAAKKRTYEDAASMVQRAWVCRARQLAPGVSAAKFSKDKLNAAVAELKIRREFADSVREIPHILADAGVRVVVVERLPGLKMDGACLWLDGNSPVIALSFQRDSIGNFWHTLFHEIDHISHGEGKEEAIIEEMPSKGDWDNLPPNEKRADEAATENSLAQREFEGFIARVNPLFTKPEIVGFARRLEVHPGIVVGQLQWRGLLHYSVYRDTLEKVRDIFIDTALTDGFGRAV
jgi:HTH-type transcriptional regulator/antitoxin HigA